MCLETKFSQKDLAVKQVAMSRELKTRKLVIDTRPLLRSSNEICETDATVWISNRDCSGGMERLQVFERANILRI
jgi:hypothetical protein